MFGRTLFEYCVRGVTSDIPIWHYLRKSAVIRFHDLVTLDTRASNSSNTSNTSYKFQNNLEQTQYWAFMSFDGPDGSIKRHEIEGPSKDMRFLGPSKDMRF
jgi:hypothetical protein